MSSTPCPWCEGGGVYAKRWVERPMTSLAAVSRLNLIRARRLRMPKMSKETASHVEEQGPAVERYEDLGGYKADLVTLGEDADLTPLLQGLPNDQCQCPHWGYVFKGRMWFRYGDRVEVFEAGDAYYVPPGHTSGAYADSEFLVFSPSDLVAEVEAHMARRAQQLQAR